MKTRRFALQLLLAISFGLLPSAAAVAFHFPWDQGHDTFQPNPPGDDQEPECPDEDNRCETGQPVDIGAGDKVQRVVDFAFPGFGPPLALIRTYHSQDLSDGPFGFGWHTNLTTRLILVTDGETRSAIVVQGNGKRKRFQQKADGSWRSAPGTYQTLTVEVDGSAALRDKDGTTRSFNRFGRIASFEDRNGNALTIGYDDAGVIASATAASGRTLTFIKGAHGRITRVTDPMGRSFRYFYNADGYMIGAVDPERGETRYAYHADSNLHAIFDPRGYTAITLTYDDQDRVRQEVLADSATYQFVYLSDTQTQVTNPRNFQTLYTFNGTGQPIEIRDPLGRTTRSTWDANYNRLSGTDGNGHTTSFTYDANGNLLTETDARNQVTTYTYEPTYSRVTSKTDAEGNAIRFEYDARGNLTKIGDAQGNEAVLTYDAQGRLASATDPRNNTTTYGYDAAGNLTRVTDPLGNATTMTFDAVGNMTSVTDAEAHTTRFEYDGLNRRIKIIDADGGETAITYDANGNITSVTNPRGHTVTYTYDSRNRQIGMTNALAHSEVRGYDLNGNLTSVTDAAGNTKTYGYDAADQVTIETLPGSASYHYEYDDAGNPTAVIDPQGVRTEQTFDAADRRTALIDSSGDQEAYAYDSVGNRIATQRKDSADQIYYQEIRAFDELYQAIQIVSGMGQTTNLDYDINGNLSTITNPLGHATTRAYDPLDRVVQVADAANRITQYAYDRVGNLTSVSDPRGLVTEYSYDAHNRQVRLDSPDTGIASTERDANGNVLTQTDSRGVTATHRYDALDRRTATSFSIAGQGRTYLYDQGPNGSGRLSGYDDESGQTRFSYDARGNVLNESRIIQNESYGIGYLFDDADRLTNLTYPSGLTVGYLYDGQGRVQQITADGQPVLSDIRYLPFGPDSAWTDGSGLTHSKTFDTDYRITAIDVGPFQSLGYLYDAADNIIDWADAFDATNTQRFTYDILDRLIEADGPYGVIGFDYDAVGNRLSKTAGTDVTAYSYAADSNRLQETTGADPGTYSYDTVGNLIQDDRFSYLYNQINRLAAIKQGAATIATYIYNAEGQRVAKTSGGRTHHFVYGPEGQLLGVYDAATGDALEEILYFGSVPVSTVRAGVRYYIHTDHLGTPRLVSDQGQNVVWNWTSEPFGDTQPNQDPDGDGTAFVLNLRFPGQFFDAETGRHYNYFRDYNSVVGRYLQSDPIGLAGGLNTYLYANGNPIRYADQFGLIPLPNFLAGAAFAYARCLGDCAVIEAAAAVVACPPSLVEAAATCAMGCLNPLNLLPGSKIFQLARKAREILRRSVKGETTVIGRVKDVQNLNQGERSLLDRLPNKGSPRANWKQNSGVLRQEMAKGKPIRDASPGDTSGQFLNAERNLLSDRGWTFNPKTQYWIPPGQ